ncbi:P-loop containing nucleoside triphosphate hydrolase protein [Scheffersomyces amazonensis]|uniref:P-loop containing nucleoside triphosphate hydrolase protein n=1 Tax=Scheffersomyces amazonensis TaxID=1078765 RepID=UPI00315D1C09
MLELLESHTNKTLTNEYYNDITKTLAHLESISAVNPAMIELQPEIQWFMRPFLLDFLIELHASFKLQPQTLFLCLNIIDRYCAKRIVFKRHYQLVGCTALWIAGKYEDKKSRVPTLKELTIMCRKAYDEEMFVQMEMHILSTLEWSLSHPNLEDCLQLSINCCGLTADSTPTKYNKFIPTNNNTSTTNSASTLSAVTAIGRFLCELSLYDKYFLSVPTSLVSITANLLACSMLQIPHASNSLLALMKKSIHKPSTRRHICLYSNNNESNYSHDAHTALNTCLRNVSFATDFSGDDDLNDTEEEEDNDDDEDVELDDDDFIEDDDTEYNENKQPEVHGAFLSGLDENALLTIKKIALMFIIQLSKVTEVLSKKYEPLGVIQVINNFHSRFTFIIQSIYENQESVINSGDQEEEMAVDIKLLQFSEILLQFPRIDTSPQYDGNGDFRPPQSPLIFNSSSLSLNVGSDHLPPPPATPPSASSQYSVFSNKRHNGSSSTCVTPIHGNTIHNPNNTNVSISSASSYNSGSSSIIRNGKMRVSKSNSHQYKTHSNNTGKEYSPLNSENAWSSPIMRGYVTDYLGDGTCKVTIVHANGTQESNQIVAQNTLENCNPVKFNKCDDMAELTHLNEPSVVYNLYLRYNDNLIYTYSGLFLVAINPYKELPIYDNAALHKFHNHEFERSPPHIFATAEGTFRNLLSNKKDQSILVTGESGAGKTENTKKIIQYLSSITTAPPTSPTNSPVRLSKSPSITGLTIPNTIDIKILRANPILESFGNAKTVKNNNSSRFGKFIEIFFSSKGEINGANIDYYLLEKSRVVHQNKDERNYHIFYQFLKGYDQLANFGLNKDISTYKYLENSLVTIAKVDDFKDFNLLVEAFKIVGFSNDEINHIFQLLAIILHLGNLEFTSWKSEQANFTQESPIDILVELMGIDKSLFVENLLRPKVKAGRELVQKSKRPAEVKFSIDAFAKHLYERLFQYIISRINDNLRMDSNDNLHELNFIGVLDIAGFEIFEINSFEQLCINYTNEKLQQFFNHHSFILEQSEYLKEAIQWEFIDFGLDLQPTIDLIETTNPMGIFKLLDEECVIPNSSDKSFMEKLSHHWGSDQSKKFKENKYKSGFIIRHYADEVEYNVDGWLEKNTDPVSENVLRLLLNSNNQFLRDLIENDDHLIDSSSGSGSGKKPKLKSASVKHKNQLKDLMDQLQRTEPHFVRCILPNLDKKPNRFDKSLVLNQLRCNGVLEGIRITRAGYPNRMTFPEFFQRYAIINSKEVFTKDAKTNSELILKHIELDPKTYKVGITKIFFKNGILGKLEEVRDLTLKGIFSDLQAIIRGGMARNDIQKRIKEVHASQLVARTFNQLEKAKKQNPWLELFVTIKPLLDDSASVLDTQQLHENIRKLTKKLEETEQVKVSLDSEVNQLKQQVNRLEDEVITTTNIVKSKDQKLEKFKSDESRTVNTIKKLEAKLKEYKETNQQLEKAKSTKENEFNELFEKHNKVNEQFQELSEKHKEVTGQVTQYTLDTKTSQATIDKLTSDLAKKQKVISKHEAKIAELVAAKESIDTSTQKELSTLRDTNAQLKAEVNTHKSLLPQHEQLQQEVSKLKALTESHQNTISDKDKELALLHVNTQTFESESAKLTRKVADTESKLKDLQAQLSNANKDKKEHMNASSQYRQEVLVLTEKLSKNAVNENEVNELKSQIKQLKSQVESNEELRQSMTKLRLDYEGAKSAKAEYADKINTLNKKIIQLENELIDRENEKENQPPDPSFVEEFANMKIKLNEQSAALRKEKFENKKLSEELMMVKERINSTPNRRSVAMGERININGNSEVLIEEINSLKIQLQQEQANAQRAESYAIELQKKYNKLESTRGLNSYNDYEKKFKESQERIGELEARFEEAFGETTTDGSQRSITKSESYGRISLLKGSNQDFAQIYQDITKTLKATREELASSKTEILRLKSLLRESEEELYQVKTQTFKASITEYEDQLAQLKVKHDTISSKNNDLQTNLELYKKRSDESFTKLELAESAIKISKRHEEIAVKELEEAKTQLKLIKEECRTSQIIIKDIRKQNSQLEDTIRDRDHRIQQLKIEKTNLHEKVLYFTNNYANKEVTEKYKDEIRALHKELNFKNETETTLVKENKQVSLDLEDMIRDKKALEQEYEELLKSEQSLQAQNEELSNRKLQLENNRDINERKINNYEKQVNSLKELTDELSSQKQELLNQNEILKAQVTKLTNNLDDTQSQLKKANSDNEMFRTHMNNQRKEAEDIRAEFSQSKLESTKEIQDYQNIRKNLLVATEENITLKKVNESLSSKVHDLEEKLYSNEQIKFWEQKVSELNQQLDKTRHVNYDYSNTIAKLEKEVKRLEINAENEAQLTKKYSSENFNFQNLLQQNKTVIQILQSESAAKDLTISKIQRDIESTREVMMVMEKEVLELREQLGIRS